MAGSNNNSSSFEGILGKIRDYIEYEKDMGIEGYIVDENVRNDSVECGAEAGRDKSQARAPQGGKYRTLEDIRDAMGDCKRCKLHSTRTNLVFGVGNPNADLMFVGEAPGRDEDLQGLPFVGRAGNLLTKIIESIGLTNTDPIGFKREDVYIANILKSRPPNNRNPEPDEIAACSPFLFAQIDVIQPKIICSLGTFSAQTLLDTKTPISKLRGRFYPFRGTLLIPTFHPAYLLRNAGKKAEVWEDMKMLAKEYLRITSG